MKTLEILHYKILLINMDKTGYKGRWNNADQSMQCKNKHTKAMEMVEKDGISLYYGKSFRRPW